MAFRPQDKDTICALATSPDQGALSLIRLSGEKAFEIARRSCLFLPKEIESHRIYFGSFSEPGSKKILDEVLVFCFKKGKSFTGEESVEISCHGGSFVSSLILEALGKAGARLAEKGEFSYRSFMNGKMDLVQAESVLALIQSRSPKAHTQAVRGLRGKLSDYLKGLEKKLLKILSHLEASIDFSHQEIEPFSIGQTKELLKGIKSDMDKAIESFQQRRIDKEGFSTILLGAPNAGKSSLFNCLVQEDRAIVTEHPGTTRDILLARFLFKQREFHLKDTAGFRKNPEPIEQEGIKKVSEELAHSDLCLFLIDGSVTLTKSHLFGLDILDPSRTIIAFSKSDQMSVSKKQSSLKQLKNLGGSVVHSFLNSKNKILYLSSRTGEGIEELKKIFYDSSNLFVGDIFLSSARQVAALEKINKFLIRVEKLLEKQASPELTAFELQSALHVLYELLGKEYNEEVIKEIFKEFCLGK